MYDLKSKPDELIALFGCFKSSYALLHTVQQSLMFWYILMETRTMNELNEGYVSLLVGWLFLSFYSVFTMETKKT